MFDSYVILYVFRRIPYPYEQLFIRESNENLWSPRHCNWSGHNGQSGNVWVFCKKMYRLLLFLMKTLSDIDIGTRKSLNTFVEIYPTINFNSSWFHHGSSHFIDIVQPTLEVNPFKLCWDLDLGRTLEADAKDLRHFWWYVFRMLVFLCLGLKVDFFESQLIKSLDYRVDSQLIVWVTVASTENGGHSCEVGNDDWEGYTQFFRGSKRCF